MARPVDYRKGRGSKGVHTEDEQLPIGKKDQARGATLPRTRKPSYRTPETKSRLARGSILRDTRARSRNAAPVEAWAAEPRYHVRSASRVICPSRPSP